MTPPRLRALTALWDRSTKKEIAVLASGSSLVVSFLAVVAAKTVGRTWRRFRRKRNKGQQQQQQQQQHHDNSPTSPNHDANHQEKSSKLNDTHDQPRRHGSIDDAFTTTIVFE
mmetsp:Transcript_7002/g.18139  ORF Transcript_7002/g.18139 Transcript_7002/m.18139 type:complete len:113 (+) Transcript_7002:164-502(+)